MTGILGWEDKSDNEDEDEGDNGNGLHCGQN